MRTVHLWILAILLVACSEENTSVAVAPHDGGGVEVDGGLNAVDAAPDVTSVADAEAATPDAATTLVDVAPVDVVDAGPDVLLDTGSATPDVAPVDVASAACVAAAGKWQTTHQQALACTSNLQCFRPGNANFLCPCKAYYSDSSLAWQNLADLEAEAGKLACSATCPTCGDFSKQVGKCEGGACVTFQPTCQQLDQYMAAAVEAGKACKQDSDCSFYALDTLACGCKVHLSMPVIGPGKPLFKYVQMLHGAYTALGCTDQVDCACAPPGSGAKCVAGQCQEVP